MPYLLGIDVGTSSVKVAVFDRRGGRAALCSVPCRVLRRRPGWVEHDPREAWRSVVKALQALWSKGDVSPAEVVGVGLSGHFSSVFLDAAGRPAAPCLTWLDTRAEDEAGWLAEHVGAAAMARYLGIRLPLSPSMPPARVRWVAQHRRADMARVAWTAQTKDFVGWKLHGRRASDAHSLMGLVRVPDGRVSPRYLARLGLSPTALPEVLPPWQVAGRVTSGAARVTGLAEGTPVVTGWIDSYCSMLGTGMGDRSMAFDVAGTSEVVGVVTAARVRARDHRGQLVIPVHTELTAVYGLTNAGSDSLRWARDTWAPRARYETLLREAEATPVEAGNPMFLPYLEGERSPIWDERASGALLGLRRNHGRGHLVRAVLEGVAFSVKHNLESALTITREKVQGVRVSGGGAIGSVANQIKADVLGRPVHLVAEPEAGALGAAMLAAVGLRWYPDLPEAVAGMVRMAESWAPRAEVREVYRARYRRYLAAYPALKGILYG